MKKLMLKIIKNLARVFFLFLLFILFNYTFWDSSGYLTIIGYNLSVLVFIIVCFINYLLWRKKSHSLKKFKY